MWLIYISICFVLINLCSSLPTITNNESYHYQQIRSLQSIDQNIINNKTRTLSNNNCSTQSINIDSYSNISLNNEITQFQSSWQDKIITDDSNNHSTALNLIEIIFTIPYEISNEILLNKTIFITDITHNQLIATLTNICINSSSLIINYSTNKSLPHNICLYLLLNITSSINLKEIIFCRIIDDLSNNNESSHDTETSHTVGPSGYFILSQCIIILLMMFIIYGVQTAREKSLLNRASQRLHRSRAYISIFGNKTENNISINPATTLQAGLNQITFHRRLTTIANLSMNHPIEEQVLAANDLTSTINDRRATRSSINRDLIDIKEFTKRLSIPYESSTDNELNPL